MSFFAIYISTWERKNTSSVHFFQKFCDVLILYSKDRDQSTKFKYHKFSLVAYVLVEILKRKISPGSNQNANKTAKL